MPAHLTLIEGSVAGVLSNLLHEARVAVQEAVLVDRQMREFTVFALELAHRTILLLLL
jgi:hypothetical protein